MIQKTESEVMAHWQGDTTAPVVSICCVTYNHENYISDALNGFLIQDTDFAFEIIVRDDCSTDKTAQIIQEYEKKFPNIIKPIYETENQYSKGVRATPVALKAAKGKYIALCEGDDYWIDPTKLQQQHDFLDSNSDFVVCHHRCSSIDKDNQLIKEDVLPVYRDYSQNELIAGRSEMLTNTLMFRNSVSYEDIKKFSHFIAGDSVLSHLLGFHGKAKFIDTIQNSRFRIHQGSVWSPKSVLEQVNLLVPAFIAIRDNIPQDFPQRASIVKLTDWRFGHIFDYCLMHFFYKRSFLGYVACLKRLWQQSNINRVKIYTIHLQHLKRIVLKKIKHFLRLKSKR